MSLNISLENRRVLVTGAAGGLGLVVMRQLAECGARVVASDVPSAGLDDAVGPLDTTSNVANALSGDLSDVEFARRLPRRAAEMMDGLDGLVHAAGIMQTKPMSDLQASEWQRMIDINLTATFHVTQQAANLMAESEGGSIVLFASVAARSGRPDAAHYSASKTGLLSLTKSAALAYGPTVRVNAVCPGLFLTPMWDGIIEERDRAFGEGSGKGYLDLVAGSAALRRPGDPAELANVVSFLLSDLSSYVTGQAVNVDGGLEMD